MIISRTPFRISFFGGGTDYPAWYRQHDGAVLACTINKFCYLFCRYLPPFFEHRLRVVYSKIEMCQTPDEISHPAVREILRYLELDRGIEVHYDGDLPGRSGNVPPGCRFAPRCPIAKPECSNAIPELVEVEPQRWVRCPFWQV